MCCTSGASLLTCHSTPCALKGVLIWFRLFLFLPCHAWVPWLYDFWHMSSYKVEIFDVDRVGSGCRCVGERRDLRMEGWR